jgi:hypothetical protein
MIEAITANGEVLDPGIIFKGKDLQEQWLLEEFKKLCPNWRFLTSPNGWTNNQIGVAWLEQVLIPQMATRRKDESGAVVLILDGHYSHASVSSLLILKFLSAEKNPSWSSN